MRRRLLKSMLLIVIAVELLSILLFTELQNRAEYEETKRALKSEASYAAAGYATGGEAFLKKIEGKAGDRITIVDADGTVRYDSALATEELGSYAKRPEIKAAREKGEGYSERYSEDMRQESLYYAIALEDGAVLRISTERDSLWQLYIDLRWNVLGLLLVTLALTLLLVGFVAKRLVEPINRIDLRDPERSDPYPELRPLTDRICEQNRQIARQIETLEDEVEGKKREADFRKEFTANVSHELKTPLTSISGFAELIREGVAQEADIRPFAGRIYEEARRMRSLVDDIITISKLDEGAGFYTKEPVDLYRLCKQVISELEPVARKKDVRFHLEGESLIVAGVESILYEMIFNICDNAIRYNRTGGEVTVAVFFADRRAAVRVTDTGIGIPEEDRERVFERFYMVDKSHSRQLGGTGLGLAIVKHGAKFHGADITLDSEQDKGTAMTIYFERTENEKKERK